MRIQKKVMPVPEQQDVVALNRACVQEALLSTSVTLQRTQQLSLELDPESGAIVSIGNKTGLQGVKATNALVGVTVSYKNKQRSYQIDNMRQEEKELHQDQSMYQFFEKAIEDAFQ